MRRAFAGVQPGVPVDQLHRARGGATDLPDAAVTRRSGVQHLVKLSQLHAEARAPGRFLRYHAAVEAAVRASGLTFTLLRPNLFMQGLLDFW